MGASGPVHQHNEQSAAAGLIAARNERFAGRVRPQKGSHRTGGASARAAEQKFNW